MKLKFLCLWALISSGHLFSQGCSDAGFCTMGSGATKPDDSTYIKKHKLALLVTNGIGDEGVYVFTPALQYDLDLRKGFSFQSRITGNYANGNLGSVSAPGDLYLSANYKFSQNSKIKHVFTVGSKLPLSQSDLTADSKPLPMQYQSSLGTIDAIVLYALHLKKFTVHAGWQQALSGSNKNEFLPSAWNTETAAKYPATNAFNRKGDVLFRLTYDIITHSKIQWNASLLSIYHLSNDDYSDSGLSLEPIQIKGSQGLTLNLTTSFNYIISTKFSFTLLAGMPLIVREIRPDGLTRAFVISPQFNYHF